MFLKLFPAFPYFTTELPTKSFVDKIVPKSSIQKNLKIQPMKVSSKIKKELWQLRNKFLHFLWKHSRKKELTIDGYLIQYLTLPFIWTAWKTPEPFTIGLCLTHQPSKTVMVFLTHKECSTPEFRYTLFHEFIEGNYFLESFAKETEPKIRSIIESFPKYFSQTVFEAFRRSQKNKEHLAALVFELDLARREMKPEELDNFIKDILKRRI